MNQVKQTRYTRIQMEDNSYLLKSCARCQGDIVYRNDSDGDYYDCLGCGRHSYPYIVSSSLNLDKLSSELRDLPNSIEPSFLEQKVDPRTNLDNKPRSKN